MTHFQHRPDCPTALILNVGSTHWGVCEHHKVRWCIGSNLLSHWKEETEHDWYINTQLLKKFTEI